MSETVRRLKVSRSAWPALAAVYNWAIHEAIEAEYRAAVASDAALSGISPTYPTIVRLLAETVGEEEVER